MSLRPMLWSVPSVEPLRKIVGSNNAKWMEPIEAAMRKRDDSSAERAKEHERFRKAAGELLAGRVEGPAERDEHVEIVTVWAQPTLSLRGFDYDADPATLDPAQPRMLTDGDWKHAAWEEYRELIEPLVDEDVLRLAGYLVDGRPLAGARIESSWSYYAWLDRPELARLIEGLTDAARADPSLADEIDEFHGELIPWLEAASACGALWLYAS